MASRIGRECPARCQPAQPANRQADLAELRKQLLASGKTIGFVARENED